MLKGSRLVGFQPQVIRPAKQRRQTGKSPTGGHKNRKQRKQAA